MSSQRLAERAEIRPAGLNGGTIRMHWDHMQSKYVVKITSGEYYASSREELIGTVLGSCISACIYDPVLRMGGINHFMLPGLINSQEDQWGSTIVSASARYGNVAMEKLINAILKKGGKRERLLVKIAGGGNVLGINSDVGARNIAYVREYIKLEGLKLTGEDVAGNSPRKILFDPLTGRLMVKKLDSSRSKVARQEQEYSKQISVEPVAGDVVLF